MSRGNSNAIVQSIAIRTRRPIVGIAHRWYERCRNHPRNPFTLIPNTFATPL